jgi:hypothetical protein
MVAKGAPVFETGKISWKHMRLLAFLQRAVTCFKADSRVWNPTVKGAPIQKEKSSARFGPRVGGMRIASYR